MSKTSQFETAFKDNSGSVAQLKEQKNKKRGTLVVSWQTYYGVS